MLQFNNISFAPALAEIHTKCFDSPWPEPVFKDLLALPTTFGFMTEQGFILCSDLGTDLEILTLGVLPDYRRKGLATELLNALKQYAKDNTKSNIFLEVKSTNTPAIRLYQKNDFIQTGYRKNYYHEGGQTFDAMCLTWHQKTSD